MFDRIKKFINPPPDPARIGLMRGRVRQVSAQSPLRPPWALAEVDFLQACTRCDDCLRVCPERLIQRGEGGYPQVDFSAAHCSFCGDCVAHCEPQALRKMDADDAVRAPWKLWPQVSAACLLQKQVACRSCGDLCDAKAIQFILVAGRGGIPQMQIHTEDCTGCGACVAPCPTQAIALQGIRA